MLSLNPSAPPGSPAALSFLSVTIPSAPTQTPMQAGAGFLPLNPAAPIGTPAPLAFLWPVAAPAPVGIIKRGRPNLYTFRFLPNTFTYRAGDKAPFVWEVTDLFGADVPVPTEPRYLVIRDGNKNIVEAQTSFYCPGQAPAPSQQVGGILLVPDGLKGAFEAVCTARFDQGLPGAEQTLVLSQPFRIM